MAYPSIGYRQGFSGPRAHQLFKYSPKPLHLNAKKVKHTKLLERLMESSGRHFVLVHGAGHGAWCWYKLLALLKSAGHRVTALDLGASGQDLRRLDDLASIQDYRQPLMDFMASLPHGERVILVGHSYGGFPISLAMEAHPHKISAAVYVTAFMPNVKDPPATLLQEFFRRVSPEGYMDSQFTFDYESPHDLPTSGLFGPNYIAAVLYKNCQPEDVELGKTLVRPFGFFVEELSKERVVTEEKFGSVSQVYVVCGEDDVLTEDFQRWMIGKSSAKEVKHIAGAAHMAMLTTPNELFLCLLQIAQNYQ